MRSGRLRHRLSLQSPTHTNTSVGTIVTTWGTVATIWGSIEPLRVGSREFYDSALINSEVMGKIITRYTSDVEPNYRFVFGTRIFSIITIQDIMTRNREMEFEIKEEVIR